MKKQVMVRAWEIARQAVNKFGGKVREFFRQALIMAWEEVKAPKLNKITCSRKEVVEFAKNFICEMNTRVEKTLEKGVSIEAANKIVMMVNYYLEKARVDDIRGNILGSRSTQEAYFCIYARYSYLMK